jgi:serine/threonine protein kinase
MRLDAIDSICHSPLGSYLQDPVILGSGGFGTVIRAHHTTLDRTIAVKLLTMTASEDNIAAARFLREAQTLRRLDHPNIVKVYSCGQTDDGHPYLVMEYLDGPTLTKIIQDRGRLPVKQATEIFSRILDAVQEIHKNGILHRDLTPNNVILLPDESGVETVKLFDFGLVRDAFELTNEQQKLTKTLQVCGTVQYLSPEVCLGGTPNIASEVYALGCLLYAMVVGKPPFDAEDPHVCMREHVHAAPLPAYIGREDEVVYPKLESVLSIALDKDPKKRFADAASFRHALEDTERFVPVSEYRTPVRSSRNLPKALKVSLAAVSASLVLTLGFFSVESTKPKSESLRTSGDAFADSLKTDELRRFDQSADYALSSIQRLSVLAKSAGQRAQVETFKARFWVTHAKNGLLRKKPEEVLSIYRQYLSTNPQDHEFESGIIQRDLLPLLSHRSEYAEKVDRLYERLATVDPSKAMEIHLANLVTEDKLDEAIALYENFAATGNSTDFEKRELSILAAALIKNKRFADVIRLCQHRLRANDRVLKRCLANALINQGILELKNKHHAEAYRLGTAARDVLDQLGDKRSFEYSHCLYVAGMALWAQGKYGPAFHYLQQASRLFSDISASAPAWDTAMKCYDLAFHSKDHSLLLKAREQALLIHRNFRYTPSRRERALAFWKTLIEDYTQAGRDNDVDRTAAEAMLFLRKIRDNQGLGTICLFYAEQLQQAHRSEPSVSAALLAVDAFKNTKDTARLGLAYEQAGIGEQSLGNAQKSINYIRQGLIASSKDNSFEDQHRKITRHRRLANLYAQLGKFDLAANEYSEAKQCFEKLHDEQGQRDMDAAVKELKSSRKKNDG